MAEELDYIIGEDGIPRLSTMQGDKVEEEAEDSNDIEGTNDIEEPEGVKESEMVKESEGIKEPEEIEVSVEIEAINNLLGINFKTPDEIKSFVQEKETYKNSLEQLKLQLEEQKQLLEQVSNIMPQQTIKNEIFAKAEKLIEGNPNINEKLAIQLLTLDNNNISEQEILKLGLIIEDPNLMDRPSVLERLIDKKYPELDEDDEDYDIIKYSRDNEIKSIKNKLSKMVNDIKVENILPDNVKLNIDNIKKEKEENKKMWEEVSTEYLPKLKEVSYMIPIGEKDITNKEKTKEIKFDLTDDVAKSYLDYQISLVTNANIKITEETKKFLVENAKNHFAINNLQSLLLNAYNEGVKSKDIKKYNIITSNNQLNGLDSKNNTNKNENLSPEKISNIFRKVI